MIIHPKIIILKRHTSGLQWKKNKHRDDRKCVRFLSTPLFPVFQSVYFPKRKTFLESDRIQVISTNFNSNSVQNSSVVLLVTKIVPHLLSKSISVVIFHQLKKWAENRLQPRPSPRRGIPSPQSQRETRRTAVAPDPSQPVGHRPEGSRPGSRQQPEVSWIYLNT